MLIFSTIYLGETFTFYIAVLNEGDQSCSDVCVKVGFQNIFFLVLNFFFRLTFRLRLKELHFCVNHKTRTSCQKQKNNWEKFWLTKLLKLASTCMFILFKILKHCFKQSFYIFKFKNFENLGCFFSLVCSVSYKTSDGEKMFLRKFFKFPVNKPIDVRTKFYNVEVSLIF